MDDRCLPHSRVAFAAVCSLLALVFGLPHAIEAADRSHEHSLVGSFTTSKRYNDETNVLISISISREGAGYRLGFQGFGRALHGRAPEGAGHGHITAGIFRFRFEDSFGNRGAGTFRRSRDHYILRIELSEVAEPMLMPAYGEMPMYRDKA